MAVFPDGPFDGGQAGYTSGEGLILEHERGTARTTPKRHTTGGKYLTS